MVGPGGGAVLAPHKARIAQWLKEGGHLLAIGLDEEQARSFLPAGVRMKRAEHIASYFDPAPASSLLAGVSPADVHTRDPRELPLTSSGAGARGNGVLARDLKLNIVYCQIAPWQFNGTSTTVRRTFRRTSFLLSRLLGNMAVGVPTPVLERFAQPVAAGGERRWSTGLYLDQPQEWDDPYRFFRW